MPPIATPFFLYQPSKTPPAHETNPSSLQRSRTSVKGHYRPFSTLQSEPVVIQPQEVKQRSQPHRSLTRPLSISGLHSLASTMGLGFKEKVRDLKEKNTIQVSRPQTAKPIISSPRVIERLPERPSTSHGTQRPALPRAKKKRSLASLLPDRTSEPYSSATLARHISTRSRNISHDLTLPTKRRAVDDDDDYGTPGKYVKKNIWMKRSNMTLHPYPEDAIYMRAYDPILLDNDRHTEVLLRRLNSVTNSPTFHDFGNKPPQTVMDLGCGQGHWVLEAAAIWKGCQITGFDMVDVTLPEFGSADNVKFVRGNFIKYALPFPDRSFDLIRMANLSLCIPKDKWEHVISECYRLLTTGGRLELIDDQIFFPYGHIPTTPIGAPFDASSRPVSHLVDLDEGDNEENILYVDDAIGRPDFETLFGDSVPADSTPTCDRHSAWERQNHASRDIENVYLDMLRSKGVDPHPSTFLKDYMKRVFGPGNAKETHKFHVKLVPGETSTPRNEKRDSSGDSKSISTSSESSIGSSSTSKTSWVSIERDMQNKQTERNSTGENSLTADEQIDSERTPQLSAKAVTRLGISYSVLAAATTASNRRQRYPTVMPRPTQSPGLFVWPGTFIPLPPSELEMHACKHVHELLGCKPSLGEFIAKYVDELGVPFVDEVGFEDLMWQYECFRRSRFNWPSMTIEFDDLEDISNESSPLTIIPQSSNTLYDWVPPKRTSNNPYLHSDLTHLRTIRVFEAVKSHSASLASILFSRTHHSRFG